MKYRTNGDVKEVVASAIKQYQKGRRSVQNAAVCVLLHAYKHGDYTQATVLCEGVGNKSLVSWFEDFGGLKQGDEGGFSGWSGKDFIEKRFEDAKKQMYWEYKAEKIWGGMDDLKAAKALLKKHMAAVKHVEENPADASKVVFHPELIAAIEAAVERIEEANAA